MTKVTTSSVIDEKAPSTAEETAAATEYKKKLEAEISKEMGENADNLNKDEPTEESDSTTDKEVEQETQKAQEEPEVEAELSPKEVRYKQQLEGERKANKELQARLEALEAQTAQQTPQQKLSPEDEQRIAEKQYLKEQYGLVTKEDYEALEKKVQTLIDQKIAPIKQERENKILDRVYKKYPDLSPEKDISGEKWNTLKGMVKRFLPASQVDPLADIEERIEWAYEKAFGTKPKTSDAQLRQSSYIGLGGGVSATKTKTVESEDRYSHLTPEAKAYKVQLEKSLEEDFKRDEKRK